MDRLASGTKIDQLLETARDFWKFTPKRIKSPKDLFAAASAQFGQTIGSPRIRGLTVVLFLALACPAFSQPYAATLSAQFITSSNATLNGMVTPRGSPTVGWFEWGVGNGYGQSTPPASIGSSSNVVFLSTPIENLIPNTNYICRLVASNTSGITTGWPQRFTTGQRVAIWGRSTASSIIPPTNYDNIVKLAAGDYHAMALRADGQLLIWGGYLPKWPINPPVGLTNVIEIAGGRGHSLAILQDRTVVVWGYGSAGQTNVPATASNVVAISAGDEHCLALKSDGTVVGWGNLVPPANWTNIVAIASGDDSLLALRNNGTVIGYPSAPPPTVGPGVVAIASGYTHSLALKTNGTVFGWGSTTVPSGLSNVLTIAVGDRHSHALQTIGSIVTWGYSISGTITPPPGLAVPSSVVCGDEYSMALVSGNTPPQPFSRSFTCPMNRDSVLSLMNSVWDPNGDSLSNYSVVSPPAAGSLYQYVAGSRGSQITSPNTPVSDGMARVIFAPAQDEGGLSYASVGVTASDGEFGSSPNVGTIDVLPEPTVNIALTNGGSGMAIALHFSGFTNRQYVILSATNLVDWSILGFTTQSSPGQYFFIDSSATNTPMRFFRVWAP